MSCSWTLNVFSFAVVGLLFIVNTVLVESARQDPFLHLQFSAWKDSDKYGCLPTQVHLALGKDATEMHVSWKTAAANCPSELSFQRVQEDDNGLLTEGEVQNAVGYSFLLSERDMCAEPAASHAFLIYLHRTKLTQLEPNSRYRYQVAGTSAVYEFASAAAPSAEHTFTFVAFGDMGDAEHAAAKSPGAASTLLRLQEEVASRSNPADLILHVGDVSYANGNPDIWDSFMDSIEPVASRLPYMVAVGNHEYGYRKGSGSAIDPSGAAGPYQPSWGNFGPDSRGECGVMTARRFHMPQQNKHNERDNAPFWYGFDYGSVHFTVISTEHDLSSSSRQYAWLQEELAGVDRCATPWLIVLLHRPMYVVYPHKSNREVGDHIRVSIEKLLLQNKVDMTVAGHVHSYYRTCAVFDGECVKDSNNSVANDSISRHSKHHGCGSAVCGHGIVHFVIGSAGHKLSAVERGQEGWVSSAIRKWGYGRFTVQGRDRLLAEYVSSQSGEVLDMVEVQATAERADMCH